MPPGTPLPAHALIGTAIKPMAATEEKSVFHREGFSLLFERSLKRSEAGRSVAQPTKSPISTNSARAGA
jgi:hypothetical protein